MLSSQRSNKNKDVIQKVVIVKNQVALKSTVNAIRVELAALTFALVKVARIVKTSCCLQCNYMPKKMIKQCKLHITNIVIKNQCLHLLLYLRIRKLITLLQQRRVKKQELLNKSK